MKTFACPCCGREVQYVIRTEDGKLLGCEDCMDRAISSPYELNDELYELDELEYREFIGEDITDDEEEEGYVPWEPYARYEGEE